MERKQELKEVDLQGRFGSFTISDILQMISFSGKTGTLTLVQGWNSRTITFDQGRICYVAAGARLPGMFDLLIRVGHLQRFQVDMFRQRRPGKADADLLKELVRRKLLSPTDLDRCDELLLETVVYTLFLWRNCNFAFRAGEVVSEGGVPVTIDGNHLIIEGTRRVDEWIQISPVVPSIFMIFRQRPALVERSVPVQYLPVFNLVDSLRDVGSIAREAGISQFDAAKSLYALVRSRHVEAIPPNRRRVCELFNLAVESIYMKLVLFDFSRDALLFENQLNRFATENKLKVRMAAGKIIRGDIESRHGPTELVDLYKLFIGIQNNKFSKLYEPAIATGLMEGLYLNADPEIQQMMRMYEFIEIESLEFLDMFGRRRPSKQKEADGIAEIESAAIELDLASAGV